METNKIQAWSWVVTMQIISMFLERSVKDEDLQNLFERTEKNILPWYCFKIQWTKGITISCKTKTPK